MVAPRGAEGKIRAVYPLLTVIGRGRKPRAPKRMPAANYGESTAVCWLCAPSAAPTPTVQGRAANVRASFVLKNLPVAQLDSASDSDSEGRRFESFRVGQLNTGQHPNPTV